LVIGFKELDDGIVGEYFGGMGSSGCAGGGGGVYPDAAGAVEEGGSAAAGIVLQQGIDVSGDRAIDGGGRTKSGAADTAVEGPTFGG